MELTAATKHTAIGAIQSEWREVLLDKVAKRGSGHTPDKKRPEYWDGSIYWVSLADSDALDKLYISNTTARITEKGIANSSAVVHPSGTVILSRDAGIGKSAILQENMAVSQHFMAWHCGPRLNNHFLYYWLQAMKPEFERISNGSTIKTIGLPYFKDLTMPLPSVVEQKAIVAALKDVDDLLVSIDNCIAKKRDLKQAAMQQLLTGQKRLPGFHGEWVMTTLSDLGQFLKGSGVTKEQTRSGSLACVLIEAPAIGPG